MREFPRGMMNLMINMLYGVRGQLTRSEATFEGYHISVWKMSESCIRIDLTDMKGEEITEVDENGSK